MLSYDENVDCDNYVTAGKVKNTFLRLEHRFRTLMTVYNQYPQHLPNSFHFTTR